MTLPREIRERLGVGVGDQVRFELENGAVVLYPQRDTPSFAGMPGIAPLPDRQNARSFVEEMRHDAADRAALDAGPPHPNVTILDNLPEQV